MPSKNDVSALQINNRKTLSNIGSSNKGGNTAKPAHEKQSVVIGLKFTPSQAQTIRDKAGLVPIATYMKDVIAKQTDLFK